MPPFAPRVVSPDNPPDALRTPNAPPVGPIAPRRSWTPPSLSFDSLPDATAATKEAPHDEDQGNDKGPAS
jgi:hypothetical protein